MTASKARTLSVARSLGIAVPRNRHVADMKDAANAIADIGLPAVIKPFRSWVNNSGVGAHLTSEPVTTVDGAHQALERILSQGSHALLQEWLPGRRDAVSIFYAQGRVWARFAQASYREFPALGGVSVLCESLPLLDDIVQPAEALVREIGLEGCSMVEFRRNAQGRPVLMEINPRIGGSVALAVRSGVNFPNMHYCVVPQVWPRMCSASLGGGPRDDAATTPVNGRGTDKDRAARPRAERTGALGASRTDRPARGAGPDGAGARSARERQ